MGFRQRPQVSVIDPQYHVFFLEYADPDSILHDVALVCGYADAQRITEYSDLPCIEWHADCVYDPLFIVYSHGLFINDQHGVVYWNGVLYWLAGPRASRGNAVRRSSQIGNRICAALGGEFDPIYCLGAACHCSGLRFPRRRRCRRP